MSEQRGPDIEWVHTDGPARTIDGAEPRTIPAGVGLFALVVLLIGALGLTVRARASDAPLAGADEATSGVPHADQSNDDQIVLRAPLAIPVASSREQALLAQAAGTTLLVTRHDGGSPFRATLDERGRLVVLDELKGLRRFAVDSSGSWMAAVSDNPALVGTETLWAGPIDGELTPVGVEVRGFAWHDTEPGRLGFITGRAGADTPQLVDVDLFGARPRVREVAPAQGWLHLWGDWGYVVRASRTGLGFTILDPQAEPVVESYRGIASGWVDGQGVLATPWGSRSKPVIFGAAASEPTDVPWLTEFQHVWASATAPTHTAGPLVAAQATNFDKRAHEVVIADSADAGDIVHRIPAVGATAALRWSSDAETLFFVREDHRTQTELVIYDRASNSHTAIPLPGLRAEDHWTRAIALPG